MNEKWILEFLNKHNPYILFCVRLLMYNLRKEIEQLPDSKFYDLMSGIRGCDFISMVVSGKAIKDEQNEYYNLSELSDSLKTVFTARIRYFTFEDYLSINGVVRIHRLDNNIYELYYKQFADNIHIMINVLDHYLLHVVYALRVLESVYTGENKLELRDLYQFASDLELNKLATKNNYINIVKVIK